MDKAALVHKRRKRYQAQILADFEATVQEHVPPAIAENFKTSVRKKMHALSVDASEIIALKPGEQINEAATELRDRVDPDRTQTTRSHAA